jgi:hypothetical protein
MNPCVPRGTDPWYTDPWYTTWQRTHDAQTFFLWPMEKETRPREKNRQKKPGRNGRRGDMAAGTGEHKPGTMECNGSQALG